MKPKHGWTLAGVVLGGVLAVMVLSRHSGPHLPVSAVPGGMRSNDAVSPPATAGLVATRPPATEVVSTEAGTDPAPVLGAKAPKPSPEKAPTSAPKQGKDPIKDPRAREALAWVGLDEEAEAYWAEAINDPHLSAQERQDLIEDLNEDGISDPKHPTLADLPMILNRLELIEMLGPQAMDKVNADAFMEAYKDLINLAYVAMGTGEPVR
ncbi:MAG TPA: hypothetical protein VNT26_02650 [Candidatus Sulfotelmatobacter sp.]|nr:hypothetical protein [Candidatus Sulfotelmatobacter sp.]HWI56872.1 hypothetical protein [Bacillota bacterium]